MENRLNLVVFDSDPIDSLTLLIPLLQRYLPFCAAVLVNQLKIFLIGYAFQEGTDKMKELLEIETKVHQNDFSVLSARVADMIKETKIK